MKALLGTLCLLSGLAGCGSREEGLRLHVELVHRAERMVLTEGASRSFTTNLGDRITLRRAFVALSSVELLPCPEPAAWRWLRELSPVGTAYAHSASSPRQLGTPHVSTLERGDGEALELGTLRPPPGRYCWMHLVFSPADADAEGLPADGSMEGRTLVLEGEVLAADSQAPSPFRVESSGLINVELPLVELTLPPEQWEGRQLITLAYDRWLDGVSPLAPGASDEVLRNVANSAALPPR